MKTIPDSIKIKVSNDKEFLQALIVLQNKTGYRIQAYHEPDNSATPQRYIQIYPFCKGYNNYIGITSDYPVTGSVIGTWSQTRNSNWPLAYDIISLSDFKKKYHNSKTPKILVVKKPVIKILPSTEVKLNESYTAKVGPVYVTVGCQTFPHKVVLDLAALIRKVKRRKK